MKKVLIGLVFVSFMMSEGIGINRYQLETAVYTSKKGIVYVVETILDTKTGKIIKRKKIRASRYSLPYKNRYGKTIKED